MHEIPIKPLSVNRAWKGQRFRSRAYNQYRRVVSAFLNKIRPNKPSEEPLFFHADWGFSNMGADTDNPCKPFLDALFEWWDMKTKDHLVEFIMLEKNKTSKGKEYIRFHVGGKESLIEYLEAYVDKLKKEAA